MRRIHLALPVGLASVAAVPVAIAVAAGAGKPVVTTGTASSVAQSGATLAGTVDPNGLATKYAFQYGTTTSYGEQTTMADAGAGSTAESETAPVTGLQPGTAYHFRVIAMNADGTSVSSDGTFTTTGTKTPAPAPTATTGAPSNTSNTGATVSGSVGPQGQATTYHFEYGPTADYGFETPSASAGSSVTPVNETATISGLSAGTTYHYAMVAVSPGGVTVGPDATFTTTTAPTATTTSPSQVSSQSMTFNGEVNPNGHATTYYFQYGTSTSYGLQTPPQDAGPGTSAVAVHTSATNLAPDTTYHYRLVASSSDGTVYGADQTAKTTSSNVRVSTVRLMGHMGFVSPGNVIGVEVGCFDGTTPCSGAFVFTANGRTIGSGTFRQNPETGGFRNFKLNRQGIVDLRGNRVNHLLFTTVRITTTSGQKLTGHLNLARWIWHS